MTGCAPQWTLIDLLSDEMRESQPVFVAGCNRSGTSVLRHTLERHPSFRSRNPRSPETRAFARPWRIFRLREARGRTLRRFLSEDPRAIDEVLSVIGERKEWPKDRRVDLLRVYFHFAWQRRGVDRLLEKTPRHVFHLERIFETFPRARVVLCIRHPVEVYGSLRRRREKRRAAGRPSATGGWQHLEPEAFAALYGQIAEVVCQRQSGDPRCHVIRYEDLSGEPADSLQTLGEFLGLDLDYATLTGADEPPPDLASGPAPRAKIVANPSSWERSLDAAEARAIEDALGPVLASLGYERVT